LENKFSHLDIILQESPTFGSAFIKLDLPLFGGRVGLIQGLTIAGQVLYYLSHSTSLFVLSIFEIGSCFICPD
jgi:hypothetical protein